MQPDLRPIDVQTDQAYADANDDEYDPLTTSWSGIVLAGGFLPVVVFMAFVTVQFFSQGIVEFFWQLRPEHIGFIPALAAAFCVGSIYASIMSMPAFVLLQLFRFFTGWLLTTRGACGVFGGLTGFLCTTGCGLVSPTALGTANLYHAGLIIVAVALGHFGAIYMGFLHRQKSLFPFAGPFIDSKKRISIKFLMLMTVGFAIFVVGCKSTGPGGLEIGICWSCYAVFQFLLLLFESCVCKAIAGSRN